MLAILNQRYRYHSPVNRSSLGKLAVFCSALTLSLASNAAVVDEDDPEKTWQELESRLPPYPEVKNQLPFYVSAGTDYKFMVDSESISIGTDGVVRYTLVVISPSGAQNVSHEGLRCASMERRLYAVGRDDKTWSRAQNSRWQRIRNLGANRQHAALYYDYFCPNGVLVRDAREARQALQFGGHDSALKR